MTAVVIEQKGYAPVECDEPLPCPFCGAEAHLKQLAYHDGPRGRTLIVSSSRQLAGNMFWFACMSCRATTGPHADTAQEAVEHWNRRAQ